MIKQKLSRCGEVVDRNARLSRRVYHREVCPSGELNRSNKGSGWDVRKCRSEIDRAVKCAGLSKWKNEMGRKKTLEWYREKEAPKHERWYEGSLGGDLFRARAQCMDVNARNYRW